MRGPGTDLGQVTFYDGYRWEVKRVRRNGLNMVVTYSVTRMGVDTDYEVVE